MFLSLLFLYLHKSINIFCMQKVYTTDQTYNNEVINTATHIPYDYLWHVQTQTTFSWLSRWLQVCWGALLPLHYTILGLRVYGATTEGWKWGRIESAAHFYFIQNIVKANREYWVKEIEGLLKGNKLLTMSFQSITYNMQDLNYSSSLHMMHLFAIKENLTIIPPWKAQI